ncbi:hypothetical protein PIB30_081134 [Stylosanthes scabra]|uniref:Uncharacterized protein n=1 Tax=Stylosanthes scabra TaxID=79078 RepID=A0ABU6WRD3_9FABA|nr:hypothetical protein [Stylosanthes scabra]
MEEDAYACYIKSIPRLSNSITLRRGNQAHLFHAQAWKTTHIHAPWQQATSQDPRIGVEVHAYAWKAHSSHVPESRLARPRRDQDFSKPKSATHRRRSPHICVGSQQLTFEAHVGRAKRDSILASPFQSHAYAQNSTHN